MRAHTPLGTPNLERVRRAVRAAREARTEGAVRGASWLQPLRYDERGFARPPSMPSFAERVKRLLSD